MFDTHCHIHSQDYPLDAEMVYQRALSAHVEGMICVGTSLSDSRRAVNFAAAHPQAYAAIAVHPHDAKQVSEHQRLNLIRLARSPKVVAIGECGLDYYYERSPKRKQRELLEFFLELAQREHKPLILHVREAFDDFWPIFDAYAPLAGVVHSFSATVKELDETLSRGLFVGLNGIMTFSKDNRQLEAARQVPLDRLVLETDAPFLTPVPKRGKVNEPRYVELTAEFLAKLRGEDVNELKRATVANAKKLFSII